MAMSSQGTAFRGESSVEIHLLVFAGVRDRLRLAGVEPSTSEEDKYEVVLPATWPSSALLRAFICRQLWPFLAEIEPTIALALNLRYVDPEESIELQTGDTLALIPPISGG